MANTTVRGAFSIHGTNPQYLIEKVIRARIYESLYWKEHCFALNAASIIDNAIKLNYIGGTYANQKPTEFLCLVLKLLQLQPEREIILEYLRADEFKYLRAVAAFYVRLTFDALNVYETLEPLLDDYRKLRQRSMDGSYSLTTIDEFADSLLTEERVCEIQLPRLTQRKVLEETEGLAPRRSRLGKAMGVLGEQAGSDAESEGDNIDDDRGRYMSRSPSKSLSPTPEREKTPEFWTEGEEEDEGEHDHLDTQERPFKRRKAENDDNDRYISRSPSPASETRYLSRSPSPGSPQPGVMDLDSEKIEGDV